MSILGTIGIALNIGSAATSIFSSVSGTKAGTDKADELKANLAKQYNLNVDILSENFANNALINCDNIANAMSELTKSYTTTRSNALMSTASYMTGGASYNSNRDDTIANLNLEYNSKIFAYDNLRVYNEETLKQEFKSNMSNLYYNYQNTLYGIDTQLQATKQAGVNSMINSVIGAASNILGIFSNTPGGEDTLANLFGGNKNNSSGDFKEIPSNEWLG